MEIYTFKPDSPKERLRDKMRALTEEMPLAEKNNQSRLQTMAIITSKYFLNADLILCYIPLSSEVNILPVIDKAMEFRKRICVPRIDRSTGDMDFYELDHRLSLDAQVERGSYGITEPRRSVEKLNLDFLEKDQRILVIVPGLAFTKTGKRLGRGKGFYDQYLYGLREQASLCGSQMFLWGACFKEQIVEDIPVEPHDIQMNQIGY